MVRRDPLVSERHQAAPKTRSWCREKWSRSKETNKKETKGKKIRIRNEKLLILLLITITATTCAYSWVRVIFMAILLEPAYYQKHITHCTSYIVHRTLWRRTSHSQIKCACGTRFTIYLSDYARDFRAGAIYFLHIFHD